MDLVKKINVHSGLLFNLQTRSKSTLDFRVICWITRIQGLIGLTEYLKLQYDLVDDLLITTKTALNL